MNPTWLIPSLFICFTPEKLLGQRSCSRQTCQAGYANRSAAALSPKKRGRLPAERPGGIRCFVVGAMHFNNHCTGLSTIVNGNCRAARPAPPPNKRMNPTLLFFELTNALRQRKSQTFHHSSARPARRVIRRAVSTPRQNDE